MVVGFLLLFPIGVYYRLKYQGAPWTSRPRPGGCVHPGDLAAAGADLLGRNDCLHDQSSVDGLVVDAASAWLRWTAVAFLPLGASLLVWTFRALGPNLTDTVVTRRSHTLVTRGPYRFVRHPFYDSAAVLAVATSLMMANWFVLLTGVSVFLLLAVRSRTEEDMVLTRFGDRYRSYRAPDWPLPTKDRRRNHASADASVKISPCSHPQQRSLAVVDWASPGRRSRPRSANVRKLWETTPRHDW